MLLRREKWKHDYRLENSCRRISRIENKKLSGSFQRRFRRNDSSVSFVWTQGFRPLRGTPYALCPLPFFIEKPFSNPSLKLEFDPYPWYLITPRLLLIDGLKLRLRSQELTRTELPWADLPFSLHEGTSTKIAISIVDSY